MGLVVEATLVKVCSTKNSPTASATLRFIFRGNSRPSKRSMVAEVSLFVVVVFKIFILGPVLWLRIIWVLILDNYVRFKTHFISRVLLHHSNFYAVFDNI